MKRLFVFVYMMLFAVIGTNAQSNTTFGDVNNDGHVNYTDVDMISDIIMGKLPYSDAADINKDGKVNAGDIVAEVNIILNSDRSLVLWFKDGSKACYKLDDNLKTTFTTEALNITTINKTVSYPLSEISRYTYEIGEEESDNTNYGDPTPMSDSYEYFTINFTDGTKSQAFYTTDVDYISYSKTDMDGIEHTNYQVQEIHTVDCVFRYPFAQIKNLSFKDVDANKVAENIAHVTTFINPLYLQSNSSTELAQHLGTLDKMEDVEKIWVDNQSVFVKLRDWGVINYSYPPHNIPVFDHNSSRAIPNKSMSRKIPDYSESIHHKHTTVSNVCVITQMRKDKEYEEHVATSDSIVKMCKEWGYNVTVNNNLRPEFFINDIKQYDLVFLMTHGVYNGSHWLYTNEEIYSMTLDKPINEDSLRRVAENFIKTKYINNGYSLNEVNFQPRIENRNGKNTLICYTCISNSFISKQGTSNSNNLVVFNAACQSMKNNPEMADAFNKIGASCYTGFTESNSIGPWTNWGMCESLLNGWSIYSAYNTLPDNLYTEKLELPENSGEYVYPELILWPENKERSSICITHPETLTSEKCSINGESIISLKGRIKVWDPEIHAKARNAGILIGKSQDMSDCRSVDAKLTPEKNNHLLNIEAILNEGDLEPNTTYYYCAYMLDEYSDCYGEIKSFTTTGDTEAYTVLDGETLTFYYDNKKNERTGDIYEILEMYDFPNLLPQWKEMNESIKKVSFDTSFVDYSPKSTNYWFYGLNQLIKIYNLKYLNTSNVKDMGNMFRNCSSLKSLDLSSFNTANVGSMVEMFTSCSSLTSLDLSSFNTANVGSMAGMFSGCSSLTSLDLSSFNTANVWSMDWMFSSCFSLTSLNLSSFNTAKVTSMYGMFSGCSSLTNLDLSSFNTANVGWLMDYMFSGCSSLTSLDLSSFNTANVTSMDCMFHGCSSLTSLDLSSFNTAKVTIMDCMFLDCSSLTNLDVSNFDFSGINYFGPCSINGLFSGLSSLVKINLSRVNTANVESMRYLFRGCSSLKSLDLSSFDTSNVTDMSSMFNHCSSLTSLDLSNYDTSNVTDMSSMFYGCSNLTSLDLSSFDTSNVKDMSRMFDECRFLRTIYAGNWDMHNCQDTSFLFLNCDKLVGGQGTKIGSNLYGYDKNGNPLYYSCFSNSDAAHVDGGKDNPGLFTAK